jgi:death on curing protein
MNEPVWIDRRVLIYLHAESLAEHGGLPGFRDENAFDSALARPRNKWHYEGKSDIADLAATCAFGLASNHPFVDGNKRAAFLAIGLFLALNGYQLIVEPVDAIQTMLALAAGELGEGDLADWIRKRTDRRA